MKKNIIALSLLVSALTASGQWINRLSLQIEGGNHYDIFTPNKDANINKVPIVDMESLSGPNDRFDWNGAIGVNYASTPLWTLTAMYSRGTLSGSNGTEYYLGSIQSIETGIRFHMANLNPRAKGRKLNLVPYLLYTYNGYSSALYFQSDLSEQNRTSGWASGYAIGAEASYHLNDNWTLYLSPSFRHVASDGLDGWDYGAGSDHFIRTNFGVKYRFTAKTTEAGSHLSDLNLWSSESKQRPRELKDDFSESIQDVERPKEKTESDSVFVKLDKSTESLRDIEKPEEKTESDSVFNKKVEAPSPRSFKEMKEELEKIQAETIREIERFKLEQQISMMTATSTTVFFEIDSYRLTEESRKKLYEFSKELSLLENMPESVTIEIYSHTDITGPVSRNNKLREDRSKQVAEYLRNVLKVEHKVKIVNDKKDYTGDNSIDRRVDVNLHFD